MASPAAWHKASAPIGCARWSKKAKLLIWQPQKTALHILPRLFPVKLALFMAA